HVFCCRAQVMNLPSTPLAVERIEISTLWCGFADPPSHAARLTINRDGSRFVRRQALVDRADEAPVEEVGRFLQALSRPPVPHLDPSLFDVPERVIRSHYGSTWTDDDPAHLVRVTFRSGRVVSIRAFRQHAFMLPLKVMDTGTGAEFDTYDPRL